MSLDYFELRHIRMNHPSWRLMAAENGPFIAAFLDMAFRTENLREIEESELTMKLEDYLYQLENSETDQQFTRSAAGYLDEWSRNDRGWLRKYYPVGSDTPHYDLTPAAEKALQWMDGLFERNFIGTEGRLNTAFELLKQIAYGVETDKELRIRELKEKRNQITREIAAIKAGEIPTLDDREIRERFIQFSRTAREILGDFRMVEQNFRDLDSSIREKIASWTSDKGDFLDSYFSEHDDINRSDQGRSFRAFWDFLMSPSSQEDFSDLLERVFRLEELKELTVDQRLKRIHFDWMSAGEQTQRVVARLSRQLRAYLDDKAYYDNRTLIKKLDQIDRIALKLKETPPEKRNFMEIDEFRPDIAVPMEKKLFSPPFYPDVKNLLEEAEDENIDTSSLYNQIIVDRLELKKAIRKALENGTQASLPEVISSNPLKEGLTELLGYFSLAEEDSHTILDDETRDRVNMNNRKGETRTADIPRIIFQKRNEDG